MWVCVTAACLADHDYDVTGVDVDGNKVEMINHSQSSIIEPGLTDIIKRGVNAGRLRAIRRIQQNWGAVSLICVGTPGLN
jgi:GDP-mannose 6-dehydrogenase